MKSKFVLLVLVTISFAGHSLSQTCQTMNPFISRLTGVKILSQPALNNSTGCSFEWKENGTCCDPVTLANYARNDKAKIMASVTNVNKVFANYNLHFVSLNFTLQRIAALEEFNWKATGLVTAVIEPLFLDLLRRLNTEVIKRPIFSGLGVQDPGNVFASSNIKCWNKMANVRNSALCSTCSARSGAFFWENKANLDQKTCDLVFSDCWQSFKGLISFFLKLRGSGNLKNWGETFGPALVKVTNPNYLDSAKINEMNSAMAKNQLAQYFLTYDPAKEQTSNTEAAAKYQLVHRELCKRFVRLVDKTFVEMLDEAMTEDVCLFSLGDVTGELVNRHRAALGDVAYNALLSKRYTAFLNEYNMRQHEILNPIEDLWTTQELAQKAKLVESAKIYRPPIIPSAFRPRVLFAHSKSRSLDGEPPLNLFAALAADDQVNVLAEDWLNEVCTARADYPFKTMNLTMVFP